MGFAASLKILDAAQWIYKSEMTIKQVENVPQTLSVSLESFLSRQTITFDEMMLPAIGIITAAGSFSTHSAHDFKATYDYIYYDDFKVTIPEDL